MEVTVVQNVIASHESNGLDIIIALLLSDINPLRKQRIDLVLQLKVVCTFCALCLSYLFHYFFVVRMGFEQLRIDFSSFCSIFFKSSRCATLGFRLHHSSILLLQFGLVDGVTGRTNEVN